MEQPNYSAVERWYTILKLLVLGLLGAALLSLILNGTIFGLELNEADTSEVVKSNGFADGIVPAGEVDVDEEEDEPEPTGNNPFAALKGLGS